MQVQVPDMFGSELAAALDFDGGANNLINLIQNNLIKVGGRIAERGFPVMTFSSCQPMMLVCHESVICCTALTERVQHCSTPLISSARTVEHCSSACTLVTAVAA